MSIDISVVIPSKNREKTIAACLDSVIGQSYPVKEIIVVDDGSTDDTVGIAEQYVQQGVSVIRLTGSHGAQYARNLGIKAARCEWIAFNDSDDIWTKDKLKLQVESLYEMSDPNLAVVYGNYEKWFSEKGIRSKVKIPELNGTVFGRLLEGPGPTFQSLLVPKSALVDIGGLDENVPSYQEWDTALRLARNGKFVHIPQCLFLWRQGASDTISSNKSRDISGYQYIIDKYRHEMGERLFFKHQLNNLLRALRWGLYDQAVDIVNQKKLEQGVFRMIRFFANRKYTPPAQIRFLCRISHSVLEILKPWKVKYD